MDRVKYNGLEGQKINKLTALQRISNDPRSRAIRYLWECECGGTVECSARSVVTGATTSCGCVFNAWVKEFRYINRSHGESKTRLHRIWSGMKSRCNLPSSDSYRRYGGRGIRVCDEWNESFDVFRKWALDNGYTDELSIDRINNDKGYSPDNCRWASGIEQQSNRKNTLFITNDGITKPLSQWARESGIPASTLWRRVKNGWTEQEALSVRPWKGNNIHVLRDQTTIERNELMAGD